MGWENDEVITTKGPAWLSDPVEANPRGQLGALAAKSTAAVASALAQKDVGVDYSGMNEPIAQAAYSIIAKPEDRTAYLKERYGPGNVSQDSFGRDVVKVGDKKVAFKSRNEATPFMQGMGEHAGDVLPMLGMAAGGIAGATASAPVLGSAAIPGAALGGGAGVAANSLIANALGLPSSQGSPEVARDVIGGAAQGAGAETLGQGAMLAGRTLLAPYKPGSILGPWERTQPLYEQQMADVQAARDMGLRPKVGTFAPNAPLVQRVQQAGMRVFGDELPNINRPILEGKTNELIAQAGEGKGVPANDLNAALSRKADITLERSKFAAEVAQQDAVAELRKAQALQEKWMGPSPTGKLASSASEDILKSRKDFGDKASELYAPVDAMVGKPTVPTQPLKDMVGSIIETMPKTQSGQLSVLTPEKLAKFAKGVNELPEYVTFQQMQAIRTKFRDSSDVSVLDAGLSDRQANLLSKAADSAFEAAKTGPFAGTAEASQALTKADNFYRAGMLRYDDLSVKALIKDASDTGFVQPEKIAQFIATPGQTEKLLRIKKVVSPETFQQVSAERWKQMTGDAEDILTGQIDGKKLVKQFDNMGGSLDVLYGQNRANEMRALAKQWAMLGGKATDLAEPGAIKTAVEAQAKANELQKSTWMMNIGRQGKESLQAAEYLTQPQNGLQFQQARQTFGEQSPEIAATKEYLARKIFSSMVQPATKGAEKYGKTELMGAPLQAELNRYGRPYLEDVFGRQWTDSAYNFAKAAEVATRKNPSDAGALVVAFAALNPLGHLGTLAKLFGAQEILSSNPAITYMTKGIQGGVVPFMKAIGEISTRAGTIGTIGSQHNDAMDYARGARAKIQNQMQPQPEAQPASMQGVRG